MRGIQNDHERGEREKEKAKAEVDRLNRVVGTTATSTVSSAGSPTIKASTVRKPATGATTAGDQKRQWAQLAEMGIQVPDNFRAEMAMPGQWQSTAKDTPDSTAIGDSLSVGVRKRKPDGEEEEEQEIESTENTKRQGWGSRIRRYPGQTNSDHDPDLDALLSGSVVKRESHPPTIHNPALETPMVKSEPSGLLEGPSLEVQQSQAETNEKSPSENAVDPSNQATIKQEDVALAGEAAVKDRLQASAPPVFKKRKIKTKAGKDAD